MLTCGACGKSLADCRCPDADARLRDASDSEFVLFKWCMRCDRHYARCRCAKPNFGVRSGGKVTAIPEDGFETLAGRARPSRTRR